MRVRYLKPLGGTPVQRFLLNAIEAERPWSGPLQVTIPNWDQEGVFVENKVGEVISAMAFERSVWDRTVVIGYAFTDPKHRRKGHHSKLFKAVCKIAKRDGYYKIRRSVKGDNKVMIAAIEAQGCVMTSRTYTFYFLDVKTDSIKDKFEL